MKSSRQKFSEYKEKAKHREDGQAGFEAGDEKSQRSRSRTFRELFGAFLSMLRAHRRPIILALATLTVATVLKLLPPVAIKLVVDYVLTDEPIPVSWQEFGLPSNRLQLLVIIACTVAAISICASAIHLWGRWFATKSVNRVQVALRKRAFEHAVHLPLHRVYELKSGGAASLLREDAGGAGELIFSMIYNPWRAIIQLIGSMIVLVIVDWRMMLGGLVLLPVVYLTHRTWIHRIRPLWRDVRRQRQEIDGYATEAFGGMRIVRGFSRERTEAGRYVRGNDLLVRQQLFVWLWTRVIEFIWDMIVPLASTALLLYGGYRILQGSMTLGDLTMFLFYLAMLLEPLATLVSSAATFQNNLAGLDRVLDMLEEPREMQPKPGAVSVNRANTEGRITLQNVSFHYPETKRLVLREIDLEVQSGETIALVGRSGAGKTTLCNLVARFYDPTLGNIQLDGHDLRDVQVGSYRRLLGIVEQDVFLFDGTIIDNIGYGRRGATQDEIKQAARDANAHEFIIGLESQYETLIGERGVKLSGGQRQRLAIARALLADPMILILDEATSNLDSESEQLIHESLRRLMRGRTCFVIAHRMSTIALAGRIAVLDQGELITIGPHDELIETSDIYRRMVELQTVPETRTTTPSD